jgi:DHA2 family multidrug resistance protein
VRLVDNRLLIAFGFSVLSVSTWMLGGFNLDIAMRNVVWPNVISGFAMGFIFVPMTTAAMGALRNEQMGNATGLYNLMRNIGGSFGIAVATTLLSRGAQRHQAVLAQHVTPYDQAPQQYLGRLGELFGSAVGSAHDSAQLALAALYDLVVRQAMLLAFVDTFRLMSVLCVCCVPLVWLFRRVRVGAPPVTAH